MTVRFTYRDKRHEVQAEINRRERKYPHLTGAGVLKFSKATRQLEIMRAIERDYAALEEHEKTNVES